MNMHLSTFFSLLAFVFVCGCGNNNDEAATEKAEAYASSTDENTLNSTRFGISVRHPDGWYSLDYDQLNGLLEIGADVATKGNDDLDKVIEATKKNNYNIFAIMQHEPGTPVEENPNVIGLAENVSLAPGIKRGSDYFFHARKLMEQANPNSIFAEAYETRIIDGVEFDQMDVTVEMAGVVTAQSYYAARNNDFVILIIQSYVSNEGKTATDEVIDTITLNW
ncbi:MAG: hypothetical protein AAFX54_07110 [Pseudomonadota bacterium]